MFVVYHTTYSGSLLPANYIGSTSLENFNSGYMGSVTSKQYKDIWKAELTENINLFKSVIISMHSSRKEALEKENKIQKLFNVVSNPLFINKSYAQINGCHGMNVKGKNNPMYNNGHLIKGNRNGRYKKPVTKETRNKISNSLKNKVSCVDANGNRFFITREEFNLSQNLHSNRKNTTSITNVFTKEKLDINNTELINYPTEWVPSSNLKSHNYIYHTPFGSFIRKSSIGLDSGTPINWCLNCDRVINQSTVNSSKKLKLINKNDVGKTFFDLGYYAEKISDLA